MKTTLNKIRENRPCGIRPNGDGTLVGLLKLMAFLGKEKTDDDPVSILQILDSNGLDDALWCLRAVDGYDKEKRLYAVWCARQVQHLMTDARSIKALDVAEQFALGNATVEELKAAYSASRSATASLAADAAEAAASWSATKTAGGTADAAWSTAEAATWSAARAATRSSSASARSEMLTKQEEQLRKILSEIKE